MKKKSTVGFIGAGNMGRALIQGIHFAKLPEIENISVLEIDAEKAKDLKKTFGANIVTSTAEMLEECDLIFLCVKPNSLEEVCKNIRIGGGRIPVVSIAAGIVLEQLRSWLGPEVEIIRVMPNTPALVGHGMSVISPDTGVRQQTVELIQKVLSAVGETMVTAEKYLDAVTGLSGSGPAYIFIVIQSLADGGVRMGLPREMALTLATQTVIGAAEMVKQTQAHPEALKDMVCSPGGTTIMGVQALEEYRVRAAFIGAVEEATLRSIELWHNALDAANGQDGID